MSKEFEINASKFTTLEVATQCRLGLEKAGFKVLMVGYENTNKIEGHLSSELLDSERFIKNCEKNRP